MTPTPVTVVRPHRTVTELLGMLAGAIATVFFRAWLVWTLLPVVTPWHLTYWHSLAALVLVSAAQTNHYKVADYWTKAAQR